MFKIFKVVKSGKTFGKKLVAEVSYSGLDRFLAKHANDPDEVQIALEDQGFAYTGDGHLIVAE